MAVIQPTISDILGKRATIQRIVKSGKILPYSLKKQINEINAYAIIPAH